MYPVMLDLGRVSVALVGDGEAAARRLAGLDAAGAGDVGVFAEAPSEELARLAGARLVRRLPKAEELAKVKLLLIAGLDRRAAAPLAAAARAMGILVNVEDQKPWCDFHLPSVTRRGDLMITVSTNGKSPGLARRVRQFIERRFGREWRDHLDELAVRREHWRSSGADASALLRLTDDLIARRGWLR